jgi:hypothetical protein
MQFKEEAPRRTSRKIFKKHTLSPSLEELAKRVMPKWRVADESAQDSPTTLEVDAVTPTLGGVRAKVAALRSRKRQATSGEEVLDSPSSPRQERGSGLVNMVPDSDDDARRDAKTQVFEDDEHTGAQG